MGRAAKAGCPLQNVQQTCDALTSKGRRLLARPRFEHLGLSLVSKREILHSSTLYEKGDISFLHDSTKTDMAPEMVSYWEFMNINIPMSKLKFFRNNNESKIGTRRDSEKTTTNKEFQNMFDPQHSTALTLYH